MKTTIFLFRAVLVMAVIALGITLFNSSNHVQAQAPSQGGGSVSCEDAVNYLENCDEHHSVTQLQSITGNGINGSYQMSVDDNVITTVYVVNGHISGHSDQTPYGTIIIHSNGNYH